MYVPGMDTDNFEIIKEHKVINKDYFMMKLESMKNGERIVKTDNRLSAS